MPRKLHIDLETRSAVNLKTAGLYVYAADKTTDVWVASYAIDDEEVKRWAPGQPVPQDIVDAVRHGWLIYAHNAQFERDVWREILTPRYGWPAPALEQWRCTMVMAMAMALPASLEKLAQALGLDVEKDMKGNALMKRMMVPRKARKNEIGTPDANGLLWWDDAERREK